jgi:hypothetical protein
MNGFALGYVIATGNTYFSLNAIWSSFWATERAVALQRVLSSAWSISRKRCKEKCEAELEENWPSPQVVCSGGRRVAAQSGTSQECPFS